MTSPQLREGPAAGFPDAAVNGVEPFIEDVFVTLVGDQERTGKENRS